MILDLLISLELIQVELGKAFGLYSRAARGIPLKFQTPFLNLTYKIIPKTIKNTLRFNLRQSNVKKFSG